MIWILQSLKRWLLLVALTVNLAASGCAMRVTMKAPFPENVQVESGTHKPRYSAVLLSTFATTNGSLSVINPSFRERFVQSVRESGVFTAVYGDDQAILEKQKAKLSLNVSERFYYNNALGALKGFIIGASFFILSPFIPLYADYTIELRLKVEKPDGSYKEYTGYASAESEHFFFSHGEYYADLTTKVTDAALQDMSAKLANDREWLRR
jgi:hypothetical protein